MRIFRVIIWALGIVTFGYILFVATTVFSPIIDDYVNRIEFDSDKWKNREESESELTLRWDMISDLTSDYDLIGMTVQEIKNMLGEPNQVFKDSFYYYLGSLGIDTGSLFLTIKNGVVTDYKVSRG